MQIQLGRNGFDIPSPPSDNRVRRIGNQAAKPRYQDYELVSLEPTHSNLFSVYSKALASKTRLFLLVHPGFDSILNQTEIKKPANIKTVSSIIDIQVEDSSQAIELLNLVISRYGQDFILAGGFNRWLTAKYQKIVERALRSKSGLDAWFYHIPYGSANIHNVVFEGRPDRSVIGFDFNGMYASVLSEANYPHPAKLNQSDPSMDLLSMCSTGEIAGAFVCELSGLPEWLSKSMMLVASYGEFNVDYIPNSSAFELILHANEIAFISRHASVKVVHGIYSDTLIQHPLSFIADKAYDRKLSGDELHKKLAKKELLLLHASTIKSALTKISKAEAVNEFGLHPGSFVFDSEVHLPDIGLQSNVYSINRQVLANARVKLWKAIESVHLAMPDALLCYANVDSLHYSVPAEDADALIGLLPVGNALGDLKLEFVASSGLWLDRGRWWVANHEDVVSWRSGSERLTPVFEKMAFHCVYKKVSDSFVLVDNLELKDGFFEMSAHIASNMQATMPAARGLLSKFMSGLGY